MKTMKNILLVAVLLVTTTAFGQKLGHINSNDLLESMPERAAAQTQLESYAKDLENQLEAMQNEYKAKIDTYRAQEATMSGLVKESKAQEIRDLESRISGFTQSAQKDIANQETTLIQPIIDKAKTAIEEVAKENNYTYIFDAGVGVLLYSKDSDDIMPLVKKKLGLL